MKIKRFFTREKPASPLDVTPFADIVFLLLIFFMLSSTFVAEPGIKLNLPKTQTAEIDPDDKIIISINSDEAVYLNNRRSSLDNLESDLKKLLMSKDASVVLRADKSVRHGMVMDALDKAKLAGTRKLAVATEKKF
ncbi:MAG: hypothetical protein CVU77_01970 [Elusimicrobia bacterium HGW-Elusimicrobia-1]|jgi:biopolymer transport protein ExbD|nr:MAG: hypothetical protein CVU77_01970 [Elusimicrobia bacterium HGW-Elusimicrobia-1]